MNKRKAFLGILIALVMVTLPVASAYAAPVAQTVTPAGCTVTGITTSTDAGTGVTTVSVTCAEGSTLSLSVADAVSLGLVTQNPDGSVTVNDAAIGTVITPPAATDPCAAPAPTTGGTTGGTTTTTTTTTTTGDESTGGTASLNPVGQALCDFFGLDFQTVQDFHGGYGVIAQACFMAQILGDQCSDVLNAKVNHDYTGIVGPNGETVDNWGQLRKLVFGSLLGKGEQSSCNLGAIMSGRDSDPSACGGGTVSTESTNNGHGHGHNGGHGHGKP